MGYNINIGNADPETEWVDKEDNGDTPAPLAHWVVHLLSLNHAPSFADSEQSNQRDPSYSAWDNFARNVELYGWFFDKENGKMRHHPGCAPLYPSDVVKVQKALEKYRAKYPSAKLGGTSEESYNLERLSWLAWWVEWAVANCERPAIHNR